MGNAIDCGPGKKENSGKSVLCVTTTKPVLRFYQQPDGNRVAPPVHQIHEKLVTSIEQVDLAHVATGSLDYSICCYSLPPFGRSKGFSEIPPTARDLLHRKVRTKSGVTSIRFLKKDLLAAGTMNNQVIIVNMEEERVIQEFSSGNKDTVTIVNDLAKISDSLFCSCHGDSEICVWDIRKNRKTNVLKGHSQSVQKLDVHGNFLYSGSFDNTCIIWDHKNSKKIVSLDHSERITSVKYFKENKYICTGDDSGRFYFWDAKFPKKPISSKREHIDGLTSIVNCSGTPNFATSSHDSRILIWNRNNGKNIATIKEDEDVLSMIELKLLD